MGAEVQSRDRAMAAPASPSPSDRWHLDEMVVRIAGERMYLWRAVDDEGEVLDMLVQRRRDTRAALRLMRKLLKKQGFVPKVVVTDKLRSYACAFQRLRLSCRHEQGLGKNNSIRPALTQYARCGSQHLQFPTPPHLPIHPADVSSRSGGRVARCGRSSMTHGELWLSMRARYSCRDNARPRANDR